MESITWKNKPIPITTVPKGTLLFRLTKYPKNDTRGVPLDDGTRCITPNFNVYFHLNPFVGHYMYKDYAKEIGNTLQIYKLKKDIKVILLINPSEYTRMDRVKKGIFLKPCSTVRKGCMPRIGKEYDTCLSDTIIKKFPDVVGMLGISVGDNKKFRVAFQKGIKRKTLKTFRKVKDGSKHIGFPELALYPIAKRSAQDIIVHEDDVLDTNYELLKSIQYNEDKLHEFIAKNTTFNDETNFYTYKE